MQQPSQEPQFYSPTYPIDLHPKDSNKQYTFHQENPSEHKSRQMSQTNIMQLHALSQNQDSHMDEDLQSQITHHSQIPNQQIEANIKTLERLWEYRYVRLVDHALVSNDWFKLFAFVAQFKEKCIVIVRDLILKGLENANTVDEIDHRYNLKGDGQEGIYLIQGIVVRVAKVKTKKVEGSSNTFDYSATKSLHQEFLSLNILNNLAISLVRDMPKLPRVRVPLSCLVKYMGYTALCQADSPCQGLQTLVHGPIGTIYQYREDYMPMLRVIGHCLNLKQFTMLSSDGKEVTIPFSLTLELHKVSKYIPSQRILNIINPSSILYPTNASIELEKPQFYLMSVAKLWPLFIDSDIIKSVGYLRPQVVISSKASLSNVVFCQVSQKPDPQGQLELADACKRVKEDHISALAKMLDNTTVFLVDSQGIEDLMHEYGINIRYIGSLAEKVNLEFNKRILETEMIARACKRYFFKTFLDLSRERKLRNADLLHEFKECFVDFLNLLFVKSKQGEQFFRNYIYPQILKYYDYKITAYPPEMQGGGILHALCFHFGIKIKIIDYPFFQNLQTIFNVVHILEIHGSAKGYDFDTAQIKQVCKKYKEKRRSNHMEECIKELKILSKIHAILNNQKTQPIGPLPQTYFMTELAQAYFKLGQVEQAKLHAQQALKNIPDKHSDCVRPYQILLKYYSKKKQINKGVQFYEKSLNFLSYHLGTNHPLTITTYNSFAFQQLQTHDPSKCQKMFLKSLEICQNSLGYTHATSSEILLQLAELPLPPEKKINYYLQGLNVLENLDGGEQHVEKIRRVCMRVAEIYEKTGNLQKMIYFSKRSGYWQLQIKGESKQDLHKSVLLLANRTPVNLEECSFITYYAFRSYVKLLHKTVREHLYKLFVSIRDKLPSFGEGNRELMESLKIDKVNSMTITEQLRNIISHLTGQLPVLILKPAFYRDIFKAIDADDKKMRNSIQLFMAMVSLVGEEKAEKFLTEQPRNIDK